MKSLRHMKIRDIVSSHSIETQDDLVEALRNEGFNVTQATVSRDIKELQLLKGVRENGVYAYTLPSGQKFNSTNRLKRALVDHFVHIDTTDNLIVLKCMPGTANAIGALIDQLEWNEIMGTICGDDTILIICRNKKQSAYVMRQVYSLLS